MLASNVRKLGDQFTAHLFDFIPLVQQEIVAVMPNDHPLVKSDSLHVADLAAYPMIQFSKNSGLRPLIDQILAAAHVQPKVAYEVEEDHTMAGFVRYKLGVALMPYLPLLNPSQVCIKHLVDQPLNHQIYLIVRRSGFVTPAVHRFQEFARSYDDCPRYLTIKANPTPISVITTFIKIIILGALAPVTFVRYAAADNTT